MGISDFIQNIYKVNTFPISFQTRGSNANRISDSDTPSSNNQKTTLAPVRTKSESNIVTTRRGTNTSHGSFGTKAATNKNICGSSPSTNRKEVCNRKTGVGISSQNGANAGKITIPMDKAILDNRHQEWYVPSRYTSRGKSTKMD